ncbi:TetR/AcrR family transcriptional regulator [Lactiplantibacillus mudanjiangensis]|uniref:HTH tetR-type domain-containing protein n=1 Tax=Lactiplantibacillus mudanjiangensis TaxID=1296538 RepID=A0A660E1R3_9LACO|nr:TetR-like C-terminal domain-containing protein [Lactiplantibacillus mudanjiangensis]VDG22720.1 hypothetical protein [Lactobacillus paracollinoides] [Lactiplantibacillus mudanjiangensis]VDG26743.1 hypothetical protein [Lactobacillus paracollinoides] [Lactiplantibacillus mudanjiangensis]
MNHETTASIARRDVIFNALLQLLNTQTIDKISITALCQTAGVSRMFYYRHYQSYEDIITDKMERLFKSYRRYLTKYTIVSPQEMGELFFRFFQDYQTELRTMISSDLKYVIYYSFKDYLKILFEEQLIASPRVQNKDYWRAYSAAGLTELLFSWVINGCQESPEIMGPMVFQITHS